MKKRWISGLAVLALGGAAALAMPSYTAVILGPADSYAYAAADGWQAGYVYGSGPTVWNGSAASATLLSLGGFSYAAINATDGAAFGGGGGLGSASFHALYWPNVSSAPIDLTPPGDGYATAYAVAGSSQAEIVSQSYYSLIPHAALWQGTAASFQDLNPSGFDSSQIFAMTSTQEVGEATINVPANPPSGPTQIEHAILWNGSASNYIDLNPSWAGGSLANAIYGNNEGGQANGHATIWNGTAASAVDVNPAGIHESDITAMSNNYEVGYTYIVGQSDYAALWEGSANTWVNLQQYLPSQFVGSVAQGVDDQGDVVGYATYNNHDYAVIWLAPEPSPTGTVGVIAFALLPRQRCRFRSR